MAGSVAVGTERLNAPAPPAMVAVYGTSLMVMVTDSPSTG